MVSTFVFFPMSLFAAQIAALPNCNQYYSNWPGNIGSLGSNKKIQPKAVHHLPFQHGLISRKIFTMCNLFYINEKHKHWSIHQCTCQENEVRLYYVYVI